MVIVINNDFSVAKIEPSTVYQGSDNATTLYVFAPFNTSDYTAISVYFELPDGTYATPHTLFPSEEQPSKDSGFGCWSMKLPREVTQYSGKLKASLTFYGANGSVFPTATASINIASTVPGELPDKAEQDVYEQILAYLSSIANKFKSGVQRGYPVLGVSYDKETIYLSGSLRGRVESGETVQVMINRVIPDWSATVESVSTEGDVVNSKTAVKLSVALIDVFVERNTYLIFPNDPSKGNIQLASHALSFGAETEARTFAANTFGTKTKSDAPNQIVGGAYNAPAPDSLFVMGNGTDDNERSNAGGLSKNGCFWQQSAPEKDNELVRLKDLNLRAIESIKFDDSGKLVISFKDGENPVTMTADWLDTVENGGSIPPTATAVKAYADKKANAVNDTINNNIKPKAIGVPEFDQTTGKITFETLDGTSKKEIDLPLEGIIKNGRFEDGNLILTLWNDSEITVPSENLLNPVWISDIENMSEEEKATPPTADAVKKYTDDTANEVKEYADTKVSKSAEVNVLYGTNDYGNQVHYVKSQRPEKYRIVQRTEDGNILVPTDESKLTDDSAVPKLYVDKITRRVEHLEDVLVEEKVVSSMEYVTPVPSNVGRYALLNEVGGMTYKSKNIADVKGFSATLPISNRAISNEVGTKISTTATANTITVTQSEFNSKLSYVHDVYNGVFFIEVHADFDEGEKFTFSFDAQITHNLSDDDCIAVIVNDGTAVRGGTVPVTSSRSRVVVKSVWSGNRPLEYFGIRLGGKSAEFSNFMLERGHTDGIYEPYYSGLHNAKVTAIESRGKNLIDSAVFKDRSKWTVVPDTPITAAPWYSYKLDFEKGKDYIFSAKTSIYILSRISWVPKGVDYSISARVGKTEDITNGKVLFTMNFNEQYDYYFLVYGIDELNTFEKVQFEIDDGTGKPAEYTPYREPTTYTIPEEITEIEGYGRGVDGDYYNYVDLENERFVKNVYTLKFVGTEAWEKVDGTYPLYRVSIANKVPSGGVVNFKNVQNHFPTIEASTSRDEFGLSVYNSTNFYCAVRPDMTKYPTVESFKALLQEWNANGVPLEVDVAVSAPTVTDISDKLSADRVIEVEPGGSIVTVNEHMLGAYTKISYIVAKGGNEE